MEAMNRVNLVGWLTKEVQFGIRWDGRPWGRISMVTDHLCDNPVNGKVRWQVFHNVWLYEPALLEKIKFVLTTGSHVMVEGTLMYNDNIDKNGIQHYYVQVNAGAITDLDH